MKMRLFLGLEERVRTNISERPMLVRTERKIAAIIDYSVMGEGLQRKFSSSATLPQVEQ
jgi:hypothetical protein